MLLGFLKKLYIHSRMILRTCQYKILARDNGTLFPVSFLLSQLNYARYYLPRLFPDLKEKVVFIDDDCIVQGTEMMSHQCLSLVGFLSISMLMDSGKYSMAINFALWIMVELKILFLFI